MVGISLVLAATIPAIVSEHGMVEPVATTGTITVGSSPEVTDYAVTFVESGLPAGTSWNVTIAGTQLNSTSTDIVFDEPDGNYLSFIGAVPGYTTGPEVNVTVNGGPVTVPILFTSTSSGTQGCTSYSWQGGNSTFDYALHGDCRGMFQVDLQSFSAISGYTFENSTFDVGALAEVDSAGNLAALLVTSHESTGTISVTSQGNEVNVTDSIVANVTTAIGLNASSGGPDGQVPIWSPNEALGGVGPTIWGSGSQVLGSVDVVIVLHFLVGSQGSNRVRFDVSLSGWPWANPADSLGLEIGATAEQQTYFVYTAANDTIAQRWTSNGTVASSLEFGATAIATVGNTNSTLGVTDQVALYPSGPAPDIAFALLSFQGQGGYSVLTYDPWIVFGSTPAIILPPGGPVAGATLPLLAVVGIALATALLGVVAYRLRRRRVDEVLRSLFQGEATYWL